MSRPLRKAVVAISTVAVLATFTPGASPAHAEPPSTPQPIEPEPPEGGSVTLVTGDVVTVSKAPGGRFTASVDPAPGRDALTFHTFEVDGELQVIPADAIGLLSTGRLDMDLFEVSTLLEDGYGNADRDDLPLIVEYRTGSPSGLRNPGVTSTHELPSIGGGALSVTHDGAGHLWHAIAADATTTSRFSGGIKEVWLDGPVHAALDESTGQIGAPAAWAQGLDGHGVDVAVLDTGVDAGHPDFAGRIGATRDFTATGSVQDGHGHGTHVAGTILGAGTASEPARRGVAPGAELVVGKVLDNNGFGLESWIIEGMEWAVANGADIVNMSLGSGPGSDGTDPMSMAVDKLSTESGALFVAAAGNDGIESSIGSPGNASSALTVGAVDRDGNLAPFSSRGPRLGDLAIKPEITAPGVGIAAPRAADTAMGTPVDEFYTRASGTSMATPHVAGAAALLLQQHPDWDGAHLKTALVSSAVSNATSHAFEQGNGMVRIDRAINQPVVGDGVLDLGLFEEGTDTAPATVATEYTNFTDRDISLDLKVNLAKVRTGEVEVDAVTLDRNSVLVPAGGTATVAVRVDPVKLSRGRYAGYLTAKASDGVVVSTALGTTLQPPAYQLTLKGVGIDGQPTPVTGITLFGNGDGADVITRIDPGHESITLELPADTYIMTALIEHGAPLDEQVTYLVDPELELDRDMSVTLDARDGEPIRIDTPQPAEQQGIISYFAHRITGTGRDISHGVMHFSTVQQVNVAPTDPVTSGEFEFSSRWQLVAPMVTAAVDRMPGQWDINLLGTSPAFDGTRRSPLVFGGSGSPGELAGAAGKAVIVEGDLSLPESEQVANAAAAGATALFIVRPADFSNWTVWNPVGDRLPIPAMVVANDDGQKFLERAKRGGARVSLTLQTASPYLYDVFDVQHGAIPTQIVHRVTPRNSMRLHVTYADMGGFGWEPEQRYGWRPWQDYAWFDKQRLVRTPFERTEWVSAGDSLWQHHVDNELGWSVEGPVEFSITGPVNLYAAGTGTESWFAPMVRPAAPGTPGAPVSTRTGTRLSFDIPELVDADSNYGYLHRNRVGDASHLTVRRDGVVVGEADAGRLEVDTTPGRASYEVVLQASRTNAEWTSATRTRTEWRFTSQAPASGTSSVLPMLQADYRVGPVKTAGGKSRLPLEVTFRDQRGLRPTVKTVTVEMSADGGTTWTLVPTGRNRAAVRTLLQVAGTTRTVSLRLVAATADGQELRQTIIDAVRLR